MNWIDNSIKEYYDWLREKTIVTVDEQTGWSEITTPFQGLFNDNIQLYAKLEDGKLILSDDGLTLANLELAGSPVLRSPKRKEWMDMIFLNYGITLRDNELVAIGTVKEFNQKKLNLLSAISEISDMAMLAKHTVSSLFKEDVKAYLEEQNAIYTPHFIAKGSTGIEFTFDFQIAGRQKELVIKCFNSLNKMNVPNFLFAWDDIKPAREKISGKVLRGLAIVNDTDKDIKKEYLDALESKGADYILWEQRHQPEMEKKLVA
ncbi:DUF1829 domain-containing protein [Limibacterium fermenti]|uniref:DUF1829 domain-containing protein n=1 Tax=Limibacterium fermenti TaxID=3229863 RepID=UPI003A7944F5